MPEWPDIVLHVGQDLPPQGDSALAAVAAERDRLARWAAADDESRRMVQAVVLAALRRLMGNPDWIPGAATLGEEQLRVEIVFELDGTQQEAAAGVVALEAEAAEARRACRALIDRLAAEPGP